MCVLQIIYLLLHKLHVLSKNDFVVLSPCITTSFINDRTPPPLAPPTALLFLCSCSLSKAMNIIKVCSFWSVYINHCVYEAWVGCRETKSIKVLDLKWPAINISSNYSLLITISYQQWQLNEWEREERGINYSYNNNCIWPFKFL